MTPVFVCGTGRSGTTIFTKLFGCHPDTWAFKWESQIFASLSGLGDLVLSGFREEVLNGFIDRMQQHLFRRNVRGSYDAGLFEIIDEATFSQLLGDFRREIENSVDDAARLAACRRLSDIMFLPPAVVAGASVWCEKTPRNLLYADIISKLYPEARFIHVIRGGRDVVSSMMEKNFWPVARSSRYPTTSKFGGEIEFEKAAGYWTALIDIGHEQEAALGPERWLNVRFEDFSIDVEGSFRKVFDFVGLDFPQSALDEMLKHVKPRSANTERWRRDLTEEQARHLTTISEKNLRHFNYL